MRARRSDAVLRWLARQPRQSLHITIPTCAEVLAGLSRMPSGRRRDDLSAVAASVFADDFADRILGFDFRAAEAYASIVADRVAKGRPIGTMDAMIAAVALAHGASIATRDAGFAGCGVLVIDPWLEA